ncbi:MAG: T9SS type A sorting domain-containing protein [Flavobacteriales bacterium]|nr:T9SS type A sorting domain-containing protein [Flavobacteriales bacterium]
MRKMYSLLIAAFLLIIGSSGVKACQYSDFNLVSETDLGGGLFEYTVTFCVGNGPTSSGNTLIWAVALDNGATFASFPASLTSPATGAVYIADNISYGPSLLVFENYTTGGWAGSWACTNTVCGSLLQVCQTFTFTTQGHPNSMTLMGAQGDGVGVAPYGCNGDADLVINLQSLSVDAGSTVYHCLGACANLTASVTGGAAPYTYQWEELSTPSTVGTLANITICATENETYKLTVTDNNGLVSHDFVSVYVAAPPTVSAGVDKEIYIGYGASCVSLDGYANNSMGPYTYSWSNGSTAKTPSVCPTNNTNYTLTVCDSRGCIATDEVTVNVIDITCGNNKVLMCKNGRTSCVRTNQVQSKLNNGFVLGACASNKLDNSEDEFIEDDTDVLETVIYPNPATNQVIINYGFDADATVNIDVYDASGRRIQSIENNKAVFEGEPNTSTFSVSNLNAGLYIITIMTSNGASQTHRLIVGNK